VFYTLLDPFYGNEKERPNYLKDKMLNLEAIKSISLKKHREILRFIIQVDNSAILSTLVQKTLIISGNHDPLMPVQEGKKLRSLLKNSRLVKVSGGHFEVVGISEIKEVERFLSSQSVYH